MQFRLPLTAILRFHGGGIIWPHKRLCSAKQDPASKTPKPMEQAEQQAWEDLEEKVNAAGGSLPVSVTGPLKKSDDRYIIEVRQFSLAGVEVPACCGNGNGHHSK